MRGADYQATPWLAQQLLLPNGSWPTVTLAKAEAAWSEALGLPVVVFSSANRARRGLMQAAGVTTGSVVGLPANASRGLVEAVRQCGASVQFEDLQLWPQIAEGPAELDWRWAQGCGGFVAASAAWLDHSDTLPSLAWPGAEVTVFGLHVHADARQAGALVACKDEALALELRQVRDQQDRPHAGRVVAQLQRLRGMDGQQGLVVQQQQQYTALRLGFEAAVGLEVVPTDPAALAQHLVFLIPRELDAATFVAYVRAEQTPVAWAIEQQPIHYQAVAMAGRARQTAKALARWGFLPIGLNSTDEEVSHTVLGVVKAAEYLGVRWWTQPERAAWYASWIDQLYGPGHDAYRPIFL